MRRLAILTVVAALVGSIAPSAMGQGKGKGKNAPTAPVLAVVLTNDVNGDGLPNWGDSVTFNVTTTQNWNQVTLTCSQNGVGVYGAVWPFTPDVTLSSTAWQGGAADCTAVLISYDGKKNDSVGSVSFPVYE
jgi:hypothetical protein